MRVEIYSDGACKGNPGPGGWGALLRYGAHEKELYGFEPETTNNRMELRAAIEALSALKKTSRVDLYTDSQYLQKGILEWLGKWQKNGWKTADRNPVKNQDLWLQLAELITQHQIEWHWIKGHAGHPDNERVDRLANLAIEQKL